MRNHEDLQKPPEGWHGFCSMRFNGDDTLFLKRFCDFGFSMIRKILLLWVSLCWAGVLLATSGAPIPLASFIFNHQHLMRVGHLGALSAQGRPESGIFVQIQPLPEEGEYRLAMRVLRDGAHRFRSIRELPGAQPLSPEQWITIPFPMLRGSIQGAALQALFPEDRPTASGWRHKVVYAWEDEAALHAWFLNESVTPGKLSPLNGLAHSGLSRGSEVLIPWSWIRPELELQPMELQPPLKLVTEQDGQRFASYQMQSGEALYSAVVMRFLGRSRHNDIVKAIGDLLALNHLREAREIAPGQSIRIPLDWVSPEFVKPLDWAGEDTPSAPSDSEEAPCLADDPNARRACEPVLRTAFNS
jgi:hypothetical protein